MDPISAACIAGMAGIALGIFLGRMANRSELDDLRNYTFWLLDDPGFYDQERGAIEETCSPAKRGNFGRVVSREERA
jgi:hypothetical protein